LNIKLPYYFHVIKNKNIYDYITTKTNFIMTQSAMEHFEEDLLYFEQIHEAITKTKRPFIQIHMFPSPACLSLYKLHGIRQYTPRTISKITRLFSDSSYSILFRLGNKECNKLHYSYITKPFFKKKIGDFRDKYPIEYKQRLLRCINQKTKRSVNKPSFYALIIHSNHIIKLI
jgi:hypothetical protein